MTKRKAFTMLEILFISLLLGIGLVSIFQAASRAKLANEKITQSIIANQIATEGVEILYQFRNTNFLKHQQWDINGQLRGTDRSHWNGNKCRLALNYENTENEENEDIIANNCSDRLGSGYYYIQTDENGVNTIIKCEDDDENCNTHIATAAGIIDDRYAICLSDGVRSPCVGGHEAGGDQSKYGKFYRTIRGVGLYNMATNETGGSLIIDDETAEATDAQEYRFCSMVARRGGSDGEIEICSTMTNFLE